MEAEEVRQNAFTSRVIATTRASRSEVGSQREMSVAEKDALPPNLTLTEYDNGLEYMDSNKNISPMLS